MTFRSHTESFVRFELSTAGNPVRAFELDTDTAGEDDVLLGSSREDVLADVLAHHELEELPAGWTLRDVTARFQD